MSYNTKNYTEQNGDRTVIGGEIEFKPGATVTGLPPASDSVLVCVFEKDANGVLNCNKTIDEIKAAAQACRPIFGMYYDDDDSQQFQGVYYYSFDYVSFNDDEIEGIEFYGGSPNRRIWYYRYEGWSLAGFDRG